MLVYGLFVGQDEPFLASGFFFPNGRVHFGFLFKQVSSAFFNSRDLFTEVPCRFPLFKKVLPRSKAQPKAERASPDNKEDDPGRSPSIRLLLSLLNSFLSHFQIRLDLKLRSSRTAISRLAS